MTPEQQPNTPPQPPQGRPAPQPGMAQPPLPQQPNAPQPWPAQQPPAAQPEAQPAPPRAPENTPVQEQPAVRTGDEVLDRLLDSGTVQGEDEGASVLLRCAFAPDQPFALAPAFVLCTVENGHAALRWTKKDAAQKAASGSHEQIT